jgi:probable HAF family extracellular repeat protein
MGRSHHACGTLSDVDDTRHHMAQVLPFLAGEARWTRRRTQPMHPRRICSLVLFAALACGKEAPPAGPALAWPPIQDSPQHRWEVAATRRDLGTLGGPSSFATDINNAGVVVGWSLNAGGVSRAFRWTPSEGMIDLGTLPDHDWSRAVSVNENGEILGLSGDTESGETRTVIWGAQAEIAQVVIPLLPGASFGEPTDFNHNGEVVGWDVVGFQHAWNWQAERGKLDLTAAAPSPGSEGISSQINSLGFVAGTNKASSCGAMVECWRGFVWSFGGGYVDIGTPNGDANVAVSTLGLNNGSAVVGWTMDNSFQMRPYRWHADGGFSMLPIAAAPGYAMAINSARVAVGASWSEANGAIQPTAWSRNNEQIALNTQTPFPGVAVAINESNAIVGWTSLDCCGTEHRAMLWTLERPAAPSAVTGGIRTHVPSAIPANATSTCLTDPQALVSRATLFSCVVRKDERE